MVERPNTVEASCLASTGPPELSLRLAEWILERPPEGPCELLEDWEMGKSAKPGNGWAKDYTKTNHQYCYVIYGVTFRFHVVSGGAPLSMLQATNSGRFPLIPLISCDLAIPGGDCQDLQLQVIPCDSHLFPVLVTGFKSFLDLMEVNSGRL